MKIKEPNQLWKTSLAQIEIRLDAPAQFKTFFSETKLLRIEGEHVVIGVPNPFTLEWLKSRHERLIKDTVSYVYGDALVPVFEIYHREPVMDEEKEVDPNMSPLLTVENGIMGSVIEAVTKS